MKRDSIRKRVAEAMGISERSILRILNGLDGIDSGTFPKLQKVRTIKSTKASLNILVNL
jgi:plasmid maintenance system antidote protein VapI